MDQSRGVLLLSDPLRSADSAPSAGNVIERRMWSASERDAGHNFLRIDFPEGDRCLPRAQAALWELRQRCGWVCVAAERGCAGVALSLAEQLPVDRVALLGGTPFSPLTEGGTAARRREMRRIDNFARRNLALVTAELLLIGVSEDEARRLAVGLGRRVRLKVQVGADLGSFLEAWEDNGK